MFLRNRNNISKIKRSKITDYAALMYFWQLTCVQNFRIFTVHVASKSTSAVLPLYLRLLPQESLAFSLSCRCLVLGLAVLQNHHCHQSLSINCSPCSEIFCTMTLTVPSLNLCMLGNFFMLLLLSADFF